MQTTPPDTANPHTADSAAFDPHGWCSTPDEVRGKVRQPIQEASLDFGFWILDFGLAPPSS